MTFFIGVDVGTGSARAALVDDAGAIVASASHPITTWNPLPDHYEQSADQIWKTIQQLVKQITSKSPVDGEATSEFKRRIKGIGFDATCSLVALDENDKPVSLSKTGEEKQNIILWMDHRAGKEADLINATKHEVLKFVGGKVSLEQEVPKLLWIKNNLPEAWSKTKKFFDLTDYLTYRATGDDTRSLCTLVCKWNFLGHRFTKEGSSGWDDSYFKQIGLEDLAEEQYIRVGANKVQNVGERVGRGLSEQAAKELGLDVGIPVATGLIDAHAGGIGVLGTLLPGDDPAEPAANRLKKRLAIISGTSTCHMAVSPDPIYVPGVWGPYYSAMVPGYWLLEGGQSATGSLVDFAVKGHSAYPDLVTIAKKCDLSEFQVLLHRLERISATSKVPLDKLTQNLHILPYFHGNRSPRADSTLTGLVCGLKLSRTLDDLALYYLAVVQAVAYGTRHIIKELNDHGFTIDTLFMTGGAAKSSLVVQQHANITGLRVVTRTQDAVLGGSAILAASASKIYSSFEECMVKLNKFERLWEPERDYTSYHDAKFKIFLKMYDDQMSYRKLMTEA